MPISGLNAVSFTAFFGYFLLLLTESDSPSGDPDKVFLSFQKSKDESGAARQPVTFLLCEKKTNEKKAHNRTSVNHEWIERDLKSTFYSSGRFRQV